MTGPAALQTAPRVSVAGRDIPVVLPKLRDPRLRLAAVLLTVQVLGQTVLNFKLSIAQILITIGVCALVDTIVTLWREQALVWPASAMLTGNSVALLLRASGTEHGDWWSLNGIEFFVLAALLSLATKYFVRPTGRHVFNPSNVGLVGTLLVIGPAHVFPQFLWWGPPDAPVAPAAESLIPIGLAMAVILFGAVWVLRPLRMLPMVGAFLLTLGVAVGVFALMGNEFWALWHNQPVTGGFYWYNVVLSPETLIFVFFMMSDPQTAPKSSQGRIIYGVGTALVAAALLSFQPTEFGVKLAILSSLTVTCALVPFIEARVRRVQARRAQEAEVAAGAESAEEAGVAAGGAAGGRTDAAGGASETAGASAGAAEDRPLLARLASAASRPAVIATAVIALVAPVGTAELAGNERLIILERGMSGEENPQ